MSHYRLFTIVTQGTDAEKNWKAVIRFDPFRNRLPESYCLDALFQLARACYSLKKWNEVEEYASEMVELSMIQCRDREVTPKRHLVYYYGMGLLYKGAVLERQGLYEQSKKYIRSYADLEWLEPLDLNRLNDVISGLNGIIVSANTFGFNVDHVLSRFSSFIERFNSFNHDPILSDRHLRYRYHKAIYEFNKERYEYGVKETLLCISLCLDMKRNEDLARCLSLFEKHRKYASEKQVQYYESIRIWVD